ncbi:bifunctional LLM class flavin-dependent oxidoreductase/SDR family oxidoreductase [Fibrella aquatilis]|uniref:LLM class flavin-dependent oxidoreductase n=1 Tax=Fibrella aquatilis TaxID=2817059 RepID=A0A939G7I2_9BACT|nr:bifunctional LLM class flavin-dependent oxidoreductase/SDR family oxidoreductase [Fibrella aquatilis]MBO0931461.1 LLM class flavin-dependent oxidoreductase [Fibrella aquatilis]
MKFGLMFFASTEDSLSQQEKYKLIIEAARFGDQHGFSSVWIPERHFTPFGCLYPNPAVLHAALARETHRIRLQAGSVVMPLHNPLRVAEEWAMVDNLSGGRVGISFAAGWNPADFAFFPERYDDRHEAMYASIGQVQQLWAGHTIAAQSGTGQPLQVKTYPTPLQAQLPIWITAASNPATFVKAGQLGANVLTHTLDHDNDQLAQKIGAYRQARADNGHDPATGVVTLLLHTFVGRDNAVVREQARKPYCDYMRTNIGLLKGLARSRGQELDLQAMAPAELDEMLNYMFDRFASVKGLIGTPETCLDLVHELATIGVDELACLLDFGPGTDLILDNLPHLSRLKDLYVPRPALAEVLRHPPVVHAPVPPPAPAPVDHKCLKSIRLRCVELTDGDAFYATLSHRGFHYGTGFRGIRQLWQGRAEVLARLTMPAELVGAASQFSYHPAFLDACFQVFIATLLTDERAANTFSVPVGFRQLQAHAALPEEVYSHAYLDGFPTKSLPYYSGNLLVFSLEGELLLEVIGFRAQQLTLAPGSPSPDELYRVSWLPVASKQVATPPARGSRFLVLADGLGMGAAVARQLEGQGHDCTVVYPPASLDVATIQPFVASLTSQSRHHTGQPTLQLLFLWGLDARVDEQTPVADLLPKQQFLVEAIRQLVLELTKAALPTPPTLWLMTQGGQHTGPTNEPVALMQGALWGLGRVLLTEATAINVRLVDLELGLTTAAIAQQVQAVLTHGPADDQLAVRAGEYLSPRLLPVATLPATAPLRLSPNATYVVTGGTGGLGLQLAQWLASKGARQLALLSRREPDADTVLVISNIISTGCAVAVFAVDVTQFADLEAVWEKITTTLPPVRGVFHLAGVLDDAPLNDLHPDRFTAGSNAKTTGAWHLHQLTRALPLDYFGLFSSVSSLIGMADQASYATANAFLDALAHYRHTLGLPALSINWGPWLGQGHAATEYGQTAHRHLALLGIGAWPFAEGMRVLETLLLAPAGQTTALRADWPTFFASGIRASQSVMLTELRHATEGSTVKTDSSTARPAALTQLQQATADEAPALLRAYLEQLVVRALKLTADQLDYARPLTYLGLDSLMAIELKNRISTDLALEFSVVRFMQGISLHQLEQDLLARLAHHWTSGSLVKIADSQLVKINSAQIAEAASVQETHDLLADLESLSAEELDDVLKRISEA